MASATGAQGVQASERICEAVGRRISHHSRVWRAISALAGEPGRTRFVANAEAIYAFEGAREINTVIVGRAITGLGACLKRACRTREQTQDENRHEKGAIAGGFTGIC